MFSFCLFQLQANKIDLSLNRELELQALQQRQIALERDLSNQSATLTAVKAKGEATDLAAKTIQSDVDTHTTKLLTVDSEVKILQKDVSQAKTKGEATDLTVKTIQSDVDTHSTKLLTVDSDMEILQKDIKSAKAKGAATELDVKKLTEETKGLELRMQKVLTENMYTAMPCLIHSGIRHVLFGQINLYALFH